MTRCQGITLKGEQCKKNAAEGSVFCTIHSKKTKATKTKAAKTKATKTKATKPKATKPKAAKPKTTKPKAKKTKAKKTKAAKPKAAKPKATKPKATKPKTKTSDFFTGNSDIDAKILKMLNLKDLANACQTNRYLQKLCETRQELKHSWPKVQFIITVLDDIKYFDKMNKTKTNIEIVEKRNIRRDMDAYPGDIIVDNNVPTLWNYFKQSSIMEYTTEDNEEIYFKRRSYGDILIGLRDFDDSEDQFINQTKENIDSYSSDFDSD